MEKKRKLPARAARVESVSKKRTSTPPEPRTQTPTPAPVGPGIERTPPLPKSVVPGKPLPTVAEPQTENLPLKEYQSISESGVLPESLQRSRQKWITEGIFAKYWTKVSKRKGAPEEPQGNPSKDSMTKLGTCTIAVEPHLFEATMYTVKDSSVSLMPPPPQVPMSRPVLQYGPPGGMMPLPPQTPVVVQQQPGPGPRPLPPVQQPTPSKDLHTGNTGRTSGAPNLQGSAPCVNGTTQNSNPSQGPAQILPNHSLEHHLAPNQPPAVSSSKSADPVIQMLAERAATDPDLKGLMKIVANGEASPEQLKKFQSHIDDLTRIQKERQVLEPPLALSAATQVPSPQATGGAYKSIQDAVPSPTPHDRSEVTVTPKLVVAEACAAQSQAIRSKGSGPSAKSDISGVVFEFTGGNGDRYSFPKYSILEQPPGSSQVIVSFLIVRKGSAADSYSYDPKLDYYQPITIRLYAHQGRQLEALHKVVEPPGEVRRWMNHTMDSCQRAEYVLLAMRLPREADASLKSSTATAATDGRSEKDAGEMKVTWTTALSPPPQKVKPSKKPVTGEEQYHTFINSVAAVT